MSPTIQSTLIIDDSEADLYLTRLFLDSTGRFESIVDVKRAEVALDWLRSFFEGRAEHPEGFTPQLILLDINMPKMDGFEFLAELDRLQQELGRSLELVVVMLSTSGTQAEVERAMAYDWVKGYIVKPLGEEDAAFLLGMPEWGAEA